MDDETMALDLLYSLTGPERLTAIVDIGANPIDGEPPYKPMLAKRLCTVVGFEPQPDALARLNDAKSDLETYLPYAVGDGGKGVLKVCRAPGMTSLFTPDPRILDCFAGFREWGTVVGEFPVETRKLDTIDEIENLDFLKIDVQGAELSIFRNGRARLGEAVAVQTEVSFLPLYKNQPVFGEIDLELRSLGFVPHAAVHLNKRMILPLHIANQPFASMNQLLEADFVYVRDFTQPEAMSTEQFRQLALVAHHCYASYDLATKCLGEVVRRGAAPADSIEMYLRSITAPQ
jgi:FkbM family methyltransferase